MLTVPDQLIDIATARGIVLAAVRPLPSEQVPLADALDRVLAEDVDSTDDLPPFDSSALDGFVVGDTGGGELPVVGESRAGAPTDQTLGARQAMRISTGAAVPDGGVAVVPVERSESRDGLVVLPPSADGANIRRAGEDIRRGDRVLSAGADIGPAELGALAALGHARIACGTMPRVAVLTTGDELVEPGAGPLEPGQIRNSNSYALSAQAQRAGASVVVREIVRDDRAATVEQLARALELADVVVVSGGVSVGPHDHVKPALAELGVEQRFWRVALKPGKPAWFGTRGDRYVFGLPGNPVSAIVTFHLFARPALRRLAGGDAHDTRTRAFLAVPVEREPGRDQVLRCRLEAHPNGWHVSPTKAQGSHVLTSMLGAEALALVPRGDGELAAGEPVDIELLR
jgi:molybdopterin molybdotransferase